MMRRRAGVLTRADVLAVGVLGVFLSVMTALLASRPREQASRALCRAFLGKIGKAMLVYANDYDGALPRAGGSNSDWGAVTWDADGYHTAYGVGVDGSGGHVTITSCFYLLVKYLEMPPRLFVCPGDIGSSPFSLADEDVFGPSFRLNHAWDFGCSPWDNCSYAYHSPFGTYALTTSRDPNLPVAADRNPWLAAPAADVDVSRFLSFLPDIAPYNGSRVDGRRGNAISHRDDGQNVLFLDGHAAFEHRAYCGLDQDNIYTQSAMRDKGDALGILPLRSSVDQPRNRRDSLLLHDPDTFGAPRRR